MTRIVDELGHMTGAGQMGMLINKNRNPFVIGVFGPPGSGKTMTLKLIELSLDRQHNFPIWFDPAALQPSTDAGLELVRQVLSPEERSTETLQEALQQIGIRSANLASEEEKVIVFIDEIDRHPAHLVGILQAIPLIKAAGCGVVMAVDQRVLEQSVQLSLPALAAAGAHHGFLESIVDLPFHLPPIAPHVFANYLRTRLMRTAELGAEELRHVTAALATGLPANPRIADRTVAAFAVRLWVMRAQGRDVPAGLIAKLIVIQNSFADLYEKIARDPTLLRTFEAIARGISLGAPITQGQRDELGKQDQRLREMLHQTPWYEQLTDEELRELVYAQAAR